MELSFQKHPYHFLRNIVRETRFQEETAEIIVPDSYPDIGSIADSFADAILRGKDCRDGSVTVAGGVKGSVLYIPDDQTHPRNLEVYIPFTFKIDHPALTASAQVICTVRVRSVDSRMINSRKAMLRVNLGCEICAYEEATEEWYEQPDDIPGLQLKETTYTTILPQKTAERSFAVNDTMELQPGGAPVSQIYRFQCTPELTDEKLIGNKAVFKGILRCKLLYMSDNHTLHLYEQNMPFSQYCELRGDYDEETVATQISVTGYDVDQSGIMDGQQIPISINLLAQCIISGQKTMRMIEDAYCTKGELHPQWQELPFEGSLDQQNHIQSVRHHISGDLREVLDTQTYWDYPEIVRNGDRVEVRIPASVRVLGYDGSGLLCALTGRTETKRELDLSDHAVCHVRSLPVGEMVSSTASGGVDVNCNTKMAIQCYSNEQLRTLCGGSVEYADTAQAKRPSVVVRSVQSGASLWDLAKLYKTTVDNIKEANHLDAEEISEATVILLPM